MRFQLDIVSPEGPVFRDMIDELTVPGSKGELTLLPGHRPIITVLRPGTITIGRGATKDYYAIGGGFMELHRDRITLIADAAEHASRIDIPRALAAQTQATEILARPDLPEGTEKQSALSALERAEARIHTAEKVKSEK